MLPLGCLPLLGREGVTLIAFPKEWRMTGFLQTHDFKFLFTYKGRSFWFGFIERNGEYRYTDYRIIIDYPVYIVPNTNSGSCSFPGNQNLLYGFFLLEQIL
jgi:hypothetical protein